MMKSLRLIKIKQRNWNPYTIKLLKEKGSNLKTIHKIVSVFYVFAEINISKLKSLLSSHGFIVISVNEDSSKTNTQYWWMEAQVELIPNIRDINRMTDTCVELAYNNDCEYDGWYTEVMG